MQNYVTDKDGYRVYFGGTPDGKFYGIVLDPLKDVPLKDVITGKDTSSLIDKLETTDEQEITKFVEKWKKNGNK